MRTSRSQVTKLMVGGGFLGAVLVGGSWSIAEGVMPGRQTAVQLADARNDRSPERLQMLQDIVSNLDHSIDILNQEQPDPHGYRHQALTQVTKARDAVQREIDEIQHRGNAKDKDVKENHRRDEEYKKTMPKADYAGLQTVQLHIQHALDHLAKDPGDKEGHRHNAIQFLKQAQVAVQKEMDDYARTHSRERR